MSKCMYKQFIFYKEIRMNLYICMHWGICIPQNLYALGK